MLKDWDGGLLTCKFANGHQVVIQEQGCFTKRPTMVIMPVVLMGYNSPGAWLFPQYGHKPDANDNVYHERDCKKNPNCN